MKQLIALEMFTLNNLKKNRAIPSCILREYLFELFEIAKSRYDYCFMKSATIALLSYYFYDRFITIFFYEGYTDQLYNRKWSISTGLFNEKKMLNFDLLVDTIYLIGKDDYYEYGNCIGCLVSEKKYFEKQSNRIENNINFCSSSIFSLNTYK